MLYLLDTNVIAIYLNQRSVLLRERLEQIHPDDIAVCSVVKFELFYGAMRSGNPSKNLTRQQEFLDLFVSLPFDDKAAAKAGEIRNYLASQGTPIGSYDLLIAAIAITNNLTLVTHNMREFKRVPDLNLEDWEI
ncbi:MAG: PIN domain-containing protein [Cyanobacteria bacterium]|jgi:tRNA(fMet)-specific endonuclease VapC|nr:PIN domain-containing protein [Cyanobacteria bacterium GSL.Bin1]